MKPRKHHGRGEHPWSLQQPPPPQPAPAPHRSCCADAGRRWQRRAWTLRAASPWSRQCRGLRAGVSVARAALPRPSGRSALSTPTEGCWLVSREIRAITYGRDPGAKASPGSLRICRGPRVTPKQSHADGRTRARTWRWSPASPVPAGHSRLRHSLAGDLPARDKSSAPGTGVHGTHHRPWVTMGNSRFQQGTLGNGGKQ